MSNQRIILQNVEVETQLHKWRGTFLLVDFDIDDLDEFEGRICMIICKDGSQLLGELTGWNNDFLRFTAGIEGRLEGKVRRSVIKSFFIAINQQERAALVAAADTVQNQPANPTLQNLL